MLPTSLRKLTGLLFITGAILVNIPYTLLIMNFDYPDILRQPIGDILTQFQAGGSALIYTWLAFAWVGLPILVGILLLPKIMPDTPLLKVATTAGVIASLTQIAGLLRWVFVVPILAQTYTDPTTSAATKDAVVIAFQVIHQYGGVVMGEHLGQLFTIFWMMLVSVAMFKSDLFKPWLGWFGIIASAVYALAQTELLATVLPTFPVIPNTGLYGSLLWLAWMLILGLTLLFRRS
ncbi:MAG TPA: DUF4386 domain-containing protein [Anaerolineales bacterium]|nr:DUF4386 domain-containing protein [Anaerolineales bacterium]